MFVATVVEKFLSSAIASASSLRVSRTAGAPLTRLVIAESVYVAALEMASLLAVAIAELRAVTSLEMAEVIALFRLVTSPEIAVSV